MRLAKLGEQADMTVPRSEITPPIRIQYLREMRSETWPLVKEDTEDESRIEAT